MTRHPNLRSRGRFLPLALCTGLIVAASAGSPFLGASIASPSLRAVQDGPDAESPAPDEAASAEADAPRFDPAELRPRLEDPKIALPLAAYLTSRGDAESARDHLRALDTAGLTAEEARRVAEELARVEAWIDTRDRFLAHVHATGRKFEVPDGDKRRRVEIDRIEDGVVYFAENRWDVAPIHVTDLDPLELAREMGDKKNGFEAGDVRLFVYALCGDKRWKGLLKGDDEAVEHLRRAGEHEYPVWLGSGRVYASLLELSAQPAPTGPEAGSATLASVRGLIDEFQGRAELEAARESLVQLAECAQYEALAAGGLESLFAGAVTALEEGRVRVVYSFSDPAVLRDFDLGTYSREGTGFVADAESKGMHFEDGALFAEGSGCIRTHATFEGPIDARYTYATMSATGGGGLSLGVHDDGDGYCLRAEDAMLLWWAHPDRNPPMGTEHFDGMISFRTRVEYEIRLKLDDKGNVDLSRSGEACISMKDCPSERGAVFIAINDERGGKFRISELVIEGKLTADARETLRLRSAARTAEVLRAR